VLLDLCEDIVARLSPAGELALAGLIDEQCDAVVRRYGEAGIQLEIEDREDDWCLLVGRRRPAGA
jgi:ribosomal protein L11 methylase PrmA